MSRIHPTEADSSPSTSSNNELPTVWTVWKKSSMSFEGTDGFSVFDARGKLAFRVDNYSRRSKLFTSEILLLDGAGKALFSLKPQILSMHDQWNVYSAAEDDDSSSKALVFSVRRCSILQNTDSSEVFINSNTNPNPNPNKSRSPAFLIDGCFEKRCCRVTDSKGKEVAKILRKKAASGGNAAAPVMLSDDVFSLILHPGVECQVVVALLVILDRTCHKINYTPIMCG